MVKLSGVCATALVFATSSCFAAQAQLEAGYGKLPLTFEANQGQTDGRVRYLARGSGYTVFLTPQETVLQLGHRNSKTITRTTLRMRMLGALPSPDMQGEESLATRSSYFLGKNAANWRTGVRQFSRVRARNVYPAIDVIYYGNQRNLEYDLVVSPGGDPSNVRFVIDGARKLRIDASGDLMISIPGGELRQHRPHIYQRLGRFEEKIEGHYSLTRGKYVSFAIEKYDRSRPLVVDPALSYATYLGGSGNDAVTAIAADAAGNAYIAGTTDSPNFPTTAGTYDETCGTDGNCNSISGGADVFVAKVNPTGTALVYSTFIGGRSLDSARQILVDVSGNVYLYGNTTSTDFPITAGAYRSTPSGDFLLKLDPSGSRLLYSTYLLGFEGGFSALGVDGGVYYAGSAQWYTPALVTTPSAFLKTPPSPGSARGFAAKINSSGTALEYATYLGGSGNDQVLGIAVDSAGEAVLSGSTSSLDFPVTAGSYQPAYPTGASPAGFITKLNPAGSALVFSTYAANPVTAPVLDSQGQIYATQGPLNAGLDSVIKLNSSGSSQLLKYSATGRIYVDGADNAFLYGAQQVSRVTGSGLQPVFATSLPIPPYYPYPASMDANGNLYMASTTDQSAALATPGTIQQQNLGANDVFLAKITPTGGTLRAFPMFATAILPPGTVPGVKVYRSMWIFSDGVPNPIEVPFSATVKSGSWISGVSVSGTAIPESRLNTPGTNLSFIVDNSLGAGQYNGIVTITSAGAGNSPLDIPVSLTVTGAAYLEFDSQSPLLFTYTIGASVGPTLQLAWTYGSGSFTASAASAGWLSVSPQSGFGSTALTTSVSTAGLTEGSYLGSIDVSVPGMPTTSMPVRLIVRRPTLSLSAGALSFTQVQGKASPPNQSVIISSDAGGNYSTTVTGGGWISASPSSSGLPGNLSIAVNGAGLSAGTYRANIAISAPNSATVNVPVTFVVVPPNSLTVSTPSLAFSSWPGASQAAQTISISSSPSVNWTAFATSAGNWLAVTPTGGSSPGALSVTVNPAGLADGNYIGTISIVAPDTSNSPQTVSVTLAVASTQPITVSPSSVSFSTSPGITPQAQTLNISAVSGKSFTTTASSAGNWLSVSATGTTMPGTASVSVSPASLSTGTYSGTITLSVTRQDNSVFSTTVQVTFSILAKNELHVSPSTLNLVAWPGSPSFQQQVTVSMDVTASWYPTVSSSWLNLSGYGGTSLYFFAYAYNLTPGTYTGTITVTSDAASNGPQQVTVNLTVLAAPPLTVSDTYVAFTYQGGSSPAPRTLFVSSASPATFTTSVTGDGNWLSVSPSSGATPTTLTLTANVAGVSPGQHSATIQISIPMLGGIAVVPISVYLNVGPPQLTVAPTTLAFAYDPAGFIPPAQVIAASSSDVAITQNLTTSITTESGGNWLKIAPLTGSTPASFTISVIPASLVVGTYTGHISISSASAGNSPQVVTVTLKVGSILQASPNSLTFRYLTGDAPPPAQTVSLGTATATYSATLLTNSGGNWLKLTPATGAVPGALTISADPSGLPPGTYGGTISVSSAAALNGVLSIPVSLEIGPAMEFSPTYLSFAMEPGGASPAAQTLAISSGTKNVAFRTSTSTGWISVSASAGNTPTNLTVAVNGAGLTTGQYSGSISISAPESSTGTREIGVSLRVGPRLTASPASVSFASPVGGTAQTSPAISVSSTTAGVPFTMSTSAAWLSLAPSGGTTPANVTLTMNPRGLVAGTYFGTVNVNSSVAINSVEIPVSLTLGGGSTQTLSVTPAALSFSYQLGATAPSSQYLSMTAPGGGNVIVTTSGASWLSAGPAWLSTPGSVTVSVNPAALTPGVYTAFINLVAGTAQQGVPVTLSVLAAPQMAVSASSLAFSAVPGANSSSAQTVQVTCAYRSVGFRVSSSANWLQVSQTGSQTPGQASILVNTVSMAPGTYNGTVTISATETGIAPQTVAVLLTVTLLPVLTVSPAALEMSYTVGGDVPSPQPLVIFSDSRAPYTIQVTSSGWLAVNRTSGTIPDLLQITVDPTGVVPGVYTGTLKVVSAGTTNSPQTVTIRLTIKSPAPGIYSASIVNAASYLYGPLSPGSLISIFGEDMAPSQAIAPGGPWPTSLNGVSVTVNGLAASLSYVSKDQINAQIPMEARMGLARMIVTVNGQPSTPAVLALAPAAPGIFYSAETQTAAQNWDFSNNSSSNPAPVGGIVVAYLTGQGQLDGTLTSGAPSPAEPLLKPILSVHAMFDDGLADVLFAGMAPGLVGVLQVNIRVPDIPAGTHLLKVTVGGVGSNSVPVYSMDAIGTSH